MGPNSLAIFHSFNENIDTFMYKELVQKFNAYFVPKINIAMERHNIFNRPQGADESIDNYVTDLKNIVRQCAFDIVEDSLVRDISSLNLSSNNHYIMEKILAEKPNMLEDAVQLAKSIEMTNKQIHVLESNSIITAVTRHEHIPQTQHRSRSKSTQQSRVVQRSPAQSVNTLQ